MTDSRRTRLAELTGRWRRRHDERRAEDGRPPADAERERRALDHFPYRDVSPAAYVDAHGDDMPGFTFDDYTYDDPELDAWLVEVGRLLRERRR